MPTDGADFGRMKACYGKAYTASRLGADNADVAAIVVLGVERDIRRDGGAPAFCPAVNLLVQASQSSETDGCNQLLASVDILRREFADSPLTRYLASAVEQVGLAAINEGQCFSTLDAAKELLAHLARSRCCDGMAAYLTKHRTNSVSQSQALLASISASISGLSSLDNLAERMLSSSSKGMPAKPPKASPITHLASVLKDEVIGGNPKL